MITKIYGGSDDLIEIEGAVSDEIGYYSRAEKGIKFICSDGSEGSIKYNGEWIIQLSKEGSLAKALYPSKGEDGKHTGEAKGCTSYSDVFVLDKGIEWIKVGKKIFKAD